MTAMSAVVNLIGGDFDTTNAQNQDNKEMPYQTNENYFLNSNGRSWDGRLTGAFLNRLNKI